MVPQKSLYSLSKNQYFIMLWDSYCIQKLKRIKTPFSKWHLMLPLLNILTEQMFALNEIHPKLIIIDTISENYAIMTFWSCCWNTFVLPIYTKPSSTSICYFIWVIKWLHNACLSITTISSAAIFFLFNFF